MYEFDDLLGLLFDNIKKILFPEDWFQIDLKLSKTEILAMLLTDKEREITMTTLAEYINSPMSTANGIAERLVNKGYVERDRSDTDRRIVVLRLTEEGSLLIDGFKEYISRYLKIILEELTEEEIHTMIEIVLKIARILQTKLSGEAPVQSDEIKNIAIE